MNFNFNTCRVVRFSKAAFFHPYRDSDMRLTVAHYRDGSCVGQVQCDGAVLFVGEGKTAELFFLAERARVEARYAILRARIRAMTGFHPGNIES
jgi:hypothetical protein